MQTIVRINLSSKLLYLYLPYLAFIIIIPGQLVITVISTRNFRTLSRKYGFGRKYRFIGK